ncbi:zinc metallochaperone AztD [Streptomyces amakusaensis]|uniref:Zinc metallochaperone AztD n=1 Tax=Streptomyces amakusaensis TaxID=67271 RepID=A0ABW0AG04_9ACTN
MRIPPRTRRLAGAAVVLATAVSLTACGAEGKPSAKAEEPEASKAAKKINNPLVTTYDGGLHLLDGDTLQLAKDIPLKGFNRVNPAGDDRHVLISTASGFRALDAAGGALTDIEFPGAKPGHVVRHAGRTVLFTDGTGDITAFDPKKLADGAPSTEIHRTGSPHHGVAVELADGRLLTTLGTEEERVGISVLGKDREEIARSEKCPGVHGEATAKDEAVVIGCEDGVLIYRDGRITKVDSPTSYGRIGNVAGSDESPIVLGDYKKDADAELERPEQISLIDTRTGKLRLVDLDNTSYTFRSLARGPHGEALVLGTDGAIHVIDPEKGKVTKTLPVIGAWKEPLDWQRPRPAIFVRDHTAYVSDPATRKIHAIDIESGKKLASATLPKPPNELSGVKR